jgi:hypothetical protein
MNKILSMLTDIYLYFKRYHIVAYNNRMYKGYRYVNEEVYTMLGAKLWINEYADRTKYVYDLFDIKKQKLVYDYSIMFLDFDAVKEIIRTTNGIRQEAVRKIIFNFKHKWTPVAGDQAASIYFADLMTLFSEQYKDFEPSSTENGRSHLT